jgi:hypothetical protein
VDGGVGVVGTAVALLVADALGRVELAIEEAVIVAADEARGAVVGVPARVNVGEVAVAVPETEGGGEDGTTVTSADVGSGVIGADTVGVASTPHPITSRITKNPPAKMNPRLFDMIIDSSPALLHHGLFV